ncbi:MAG TPA: GMC family oxidoreductase N-terminal domain-containing protein [Vicinamibacterales bacterium]|nr:GMC family oxidoreductase N-terminal domain-containing protein [Vicinamibacterales bacterium]
MVGAGSAGCVLAARLTENPQTRVLLLEAGPRDTNLWIHVPLGYGKLFARTDVNWAYESEPEPALNGRRIFTPRGKVLGGSSSINGLVYIRGQPEDYDGWRIPGWDFKSLVPYFEKAERELKVSDLERHELCDAFIASARALGIPPNEDFNGPSQEGTGYYRATAYRGRRRSTAIAYLRPAEKRPNLRVETGALATKILFEARRAVGVEYRSAGSVRRETGTEIILSGGAFNSPQLLELSGVGSRTLLEKHGIPVVHDAPQVGELLQDHFYARTFWRCCKSITLNDDMASLFRQARIGLQYLVNKTGPLTVSAGHAAAFVRTRPESRRPDAQIYFINFSSARRGGILHPHSGFTCAVSQLQVESRGSVHIRAADPGAPPAIRYNYLATEKDRRVMIEGLKIVRRICATPPMRDYVAGEFLPGEKVTTDDDWLAYCREMGETVFHPTSTCSMGQVVDEKLKVKGVQNLRVIDASVMPAVPSGNINAAVIALAEKAADLLKQRE